MGSDQIIVEALAIILSFVRIKIIKAFLDFFSRDRFDPRCQRPYVAPRVRHRSTAIAVELIAQGPKLLSARLQRAGINGINIREIDLQSDCCSAATLRAQKIHLRMFVRNHQPRTPNLNLRMTYSPVGCRQAEVFLCSKYLHIERDRIAGSTNQQVGRDRRITGWNRRDVVRHQKLSDNG